MAKYINSVLLKKLETKSKDKIINYLQTASDIINQQEIASSLLPSNEYNELFDDFRKSKETQQAFQLLSELDLADATAQKTLQAISSIIKPAHRSYLNLSLKDKQTVATSLQLYWKHGISKVDFMDSRLPSLLDYLKQDSCQIEFDSIRHSRYWSYVELTDPQQSIYDLAGCQYMQYSVAGSNISNVYLEWTTGICHTLFSFRQAIIINDVWQPLSITEQSHLLASGFYEKFRNLSFFTKSKNMPDMIKNYEIIK